MASGTAKAALFDALASVAQALGSGRRAEIVDVLAQGERSVEELAGEISQSVANTSQHLQVLARAGLVRSRREGTRIFYRLASDRVAELWAAVRGRGGAARGRGVGAGRRVPRRARTGWSSSRPRSSRSGSRGATWSCSTCARRPSSAPATSPALVRRRCRRSRSSREAAEAAGGRRLLPRPLLRVRRRRRPAAPRARAEGAPTGRRLPGVAAGGPAGRDHELRGETECCCARF